MYIDLARHVGRVLVVSKTFNNPAADRRTRRDWRTAEHIYEGLRFRVTVVVGGYRLTPTRGLPHHDILVLDRTGKINSNFKEMRELLLQNLEPGPDIVGDLLQDQDPKLILATLFSYGKLDLADIAGAIALSDARQDAQGDEWLDSFRKRHGIG